MRRLLSVVLITVLCAGCASREPYVRIERTSGGDGLSVGWIKLRARGDSGPTLMLVNTVHIAEPSFFGEVQDALDSASVVMLEGVKGKSAALEDTMRSFAKLAKVLGLVTQAKQVKVGPGWIRPDVDASEIEDALNALPLSARMGVSIASTRVERTAAMIRLREPDLDEEVVMARARAPVRRALAEALTERDGDDPVTIVLRNERLLDALDDALGGRPTGETIAICYGVGHSAHLVRELERRSYEIDAVTWHRVFGF